MRFTTINAFLDGKKLHQPYELKNCTVVVDAKSFFHDTYKKSKYTYITGGEYNRYASYLKKKINCFLECNITCYFIFRGAMKADLDKRLAIHQKAIDKTNVFEATIKNTCYFEPILIRNVQMEVLDELDIKYYTCEYQSRETIARLARKFNCFAISNDIELTMYNISCIKYNTMIFNSTRRSFDCNLYDTDAHKKSLGIPYSKIPLLLTLLSDDGVFLTNLAELIQLRKQNVIKPILLWLKERQPTEALDEIMNYLKDYEKQRFDETYKDYVRMSNARSNWMTEMMTGNVKTIKTNDTMWFEKAVLFNIIPATYVNLYHKSTLSGSWVLFDNRKEDAMLPAIDIVTYTDAILKRSADVKITFIGRQSICSRIWEIEKEIKANQIIKINEFLLNNNYEKFEVLQCKNYIAFPKDFRKIINEFLPGFNFELLLKLPADFWIVILALVYYRQKTKDNFTIETYCILLSHVMLGAVCERIGSINRSVIPDCTEDFKPAGLIKEKDGVIAHNVLLDFFYVKDVNVVFDKTILHNLSEYQHCLQHLNYLNKVFGEHVPCTVINKSYNGTFIYKLYCELKDESDPIQCIERYLKESLSVLELFSKANEVFHSCFESVKNGGF